MEIMVSHQQSRALGTLLDIKGDLNTKYGIYSSSLG
jgi:hypothetical protein